ERALADDLLVDGTHLDGHRAAARALLVVAEGALVGVADGVAGLGPGQARGAADLRPVALQESLDLLEAAAGILAGRLAAVPVGRAVLLEADRLLVVGSDGVLPLPVGFLLGRVEDVGHLPAGE